MFARAVASSRARGWRSGRGRGRRVRESVAEGADFRLESVGGATDFVV